MRMRKEDAQIGIEKHPQSCSIMQANRPRADNSVLNHYKYRQTDRLYKNVILPFFKTNINNILITVWEDKPNFFEYICT